MAFDSSLTIASAQYERLDLGRYILGTSTADQPSLLTFKSTVNPNGPSSYLVRFEEHKNSPVAGAEDDILSYHSVIKVPLKAFTQSDVETLIARHNAFFTTTNLTKLLRGER